MSEIILPAYPTGSVVDGSKWLVIGDSISSLNTDQIEGRSYTRYIPALSGGRVYLENSIAASGNRSDQQLAKLNTLLQTDKDYTLASVMVGTNDLSQGVDVEVWKTNVRAIVTKLLENNITPVLFTLPPRSGPTRPVSPEVVEDTWNRWLKLYGHNENVLVVDVWGIVADPKTREYRTGFYNTTDGVHTNGRAQLGIAREFIRAVGPYLKDVDPGTKHILSPESTDILNLLPGVFDSSAAPPGWVLMNSAIVRDGAAPGGYAVDINAVNPTGTTMAYLPLVEDGFVAGDTLKIVVRSKICSVSGVYSGAGMKIIVREWKGSTYTDHTPYLYGQNLVTKEYLDYTWEWKVPTGVTEYSIYWKFDAGSSGSHRIHARLAGMGLYNLKCRLI